MTNTAKSLLIKISKNP